jgi:hypothetical protein
MASLEVLDAGFIETAFDGDASHQLAALLHGELLVAAQGFAVR